MSKLKDGRVVGWTMLDSHIVSTLRLAGGPVFPEMPYETLVFLAKNGEVVSWAECDGQRYKTKEGAKAGHEAMVRRWRGYEQSGAEPPHTTAEANHSFTDAPPTQWMVEWTMRNEDTGHSESFTREPFTSLLEATAFVQEIAFVPNIVAVNLVIVSADTTF